MRSTLFLLAMLCGIVVAACGGGYGSGGGGMTYGISGTVSGSASNTGVTISLTGTETMSTTTAPGGHYAFSGLPNGSYTVTPSLAGHTFSPASAPVAVYYDNPVVNFTETP